MFWQRFYSLCVEAKTKPNPVAKELGVSSGAVTKWKNGTVPPADVLIKIATYFSVSVDYLLGKTDQRQTSPIAKAMELSDSERELIELVNSLTEDEVNELSRFVDYIISKRKTED